MPTNPSSFFLSAAVMLVAMPSAFAQVTTFNVDMSCAPDFDNVFVTGPWCGWCANDVYNTMTDPDGDGVYTVILDETVTGTIEYKYAIDGFTGQEDLVNDMVGGASCGPITDYSGYANRQTPQGSTTNDYYGTCSGICNDTPPVDVTFHVDMSAYQGSEDPSQVTWNSSANGWCGGCAPMEDFDGDGIYSITVPLEGDSIEYKFGIGNWADEENLIPESSCTRTTYDEGAPNGCCYVNRVVSAAGEGPFDVPVVCWNECSSCTDSVSTSVTFRVDMSNEDVSAFGVHIAGDFQGWDPATTEMTDPDGDMIYEYVHTFAPEVASVEYKFINGNAWTDVVEVVEGECANMGGNRTLDLGNESNIVLSANGDGAAYCFNECVACVTPLLVTFTVDMSLVSSVSEQGVHLAGSFQGWDAESTTLTDNDDGTWSTSLEVAPGLHQFKFINGAGWNGGEENMSGTSCNVAGNREAEFGEQNTTYAACFNQCGPCLECDQSSGAQLYFENFDAYGTGDTISLVSPVFELWPAAGAADAFVTDEIQLSGSNALKIEGQLTGGPMDVVLIAGLEGIQDVTFNVYVPQGSSGYYNVQENVVAGVEWAFECFLNSDGTVRYAVDPEAGGPEFTITYNNGSWIEIKHEIDTNADLVNILIDGNCVGQLPYDGEQIGGVNFYSSGDGSTLPLYYVDDISVTTLDVLPSCNGESPSNDNVFWANDISSCGDWIFGNAADESNAPWTGQDINFVCGPNGPAGPVNAWAGGNNVGSIDGGPAPAINSTSGGNSLMIDSDFYGAVETYNAFWVENAWVQTASPIDCSANPYVAISFETRYRCWDNGGSDGSEKCFVEISRDGATWPSLTSTYETTWAEEGLVVYGTDTVQCRYEVFPDSETGFETDNPSLIEIDISESSGNQENIWVRFRWVGTWGYSWEIDDINFVDIEEVDTRIDGYVSYTNYLQTGIFENGAWAQSQLPESLSAGAKVSNFGWGTQNNVVMCAEVNGNVSSSEVIGVFPNAAMDTLLATYSVVDLGTQTINYSLSQDNVDDNPNNNMASQSFQVTEYSYGRDNGVIVDTYGGDFEFACMPYYDIHNDATIYGIDVAIMEGGESGSPIRAFIIDVDDPVNLGADGFLAPPYDMAPLAESGETYLNPDASNGGGSDIVWYTFEFEEPFEATAGQILGASFEYFGVAPLSIAESSTNFGGTAAIYGPAGAENIYAWRGTEEMPMVRLNLDPNIVPTVPGGIAGCTDPQACNFDPTTGATLDDLSCLYEDALGVCGGDCSLDSNGDGVCDVSGCDALFFSEYVEGFSNNKALEIYNPTPQLVDLSDYQIERYVNGATSATDNQKVTLSGLLAPQDVVVCVLDKQDPDGVDFEAPVWGELAARADLWLNPVYSENNAMYYNGNDALVLRQVSTNAVLDVIGKVGEDPGDEGWAGLTNNHTLIRKFEVTGGDVDAVDDFLVLDEWDAIAWSEENIESNAIFDNLGVHDGTCSAATNPGCTDPSAFNYNPTATVDDGSCTYFETSCAAIGAPEWEVFELGLYAHTALLHIEGQSVTQEVVLHVPASIGEGGTGTSYAVADWSGLEVMGMPAGLAFDNMPAAISGESQLCLTYSGVPTTAGTYEVTVTGELFLSVFGNPISAGDYAASLVITIEPNGNAVFGCTYPHALNFNPAANDDDGSCAFAGCTDPLAENFEPYASVDDGTCDTEPCVAACLGDLNNDGSIGTADLLTLLTAFGGDCE